jgi:hypothetical protein
MDGTRACNLEKRKDCIKCFFVFLCVYVHFIKFAA